MKILLTDIKYYISILRSFNNPGETLGEQSTSGLIKGIVFTKVIPIMGSESFHLYFHQNNTQVSNVCRKQNTALNTWLAGSNFTELFMILPLELWQFLWSIFEYF